MTNPYMDEALTPRSDDGVQQKLRDWFVTFPGRGLLQMESLHINRILPNLFGFHVLQLGCIGSGSFLQNSRISHKIMLLFNESRIEEDNTSMLFGDEETLAIAADSMDVVVLPHVLEFSTSPHRLLREIERILIGEGHLILAGFNPWSLWGLWRLLLWWREEPPWNGHYYTIWRVKDWLTLLDFELLETERFFFRPPLRHEKLMRKLGFLEKLGKYCWPFFCGAYVIVAKKRVVTLTPVKTQWRARRQLIASGIVEPSARTYED